MIHIRPVMTFIAHDDQTDTLLEIRQRGIDFFTAFDSQGEEIASDAFENCDTQEQFEEKLRTWLENKFAELDTAEAINSP